MKQRHQSTFNIKTNTILASRKFVAVACLRRVVQLTSMKVG